MNYWNKKLLLLKIKRIHAKTHRQDPISMKEASTKIETFANLLIHPKSVKITNKN